MNERLDAEDELRRRLARSDPAADLPPLEPAHLDALLEAAMSKPTTPSQPAPPAPNQNQNQNDLTSRQARLRRNLIGVAAAAVLVAGGVGLVLSQQQSTSPMAASTALTLPAAGGPATACAELTPNYLASSSTAFAGTVESIQDGAVTLRVTERFTGTITDTVTIAQGANTGVDGGALTFQNGAAYLIAANDSGVISECGGSGTDTPELRSLYTQAFTR